MIQNLKPVLEAYLFVKGESQDIASLAKRFGVERDALVAVLGDLSREYADRGIHMLLTDREVEMVTSPSVSDDLNALLKTETGETLSAAALETLAIVAYAGPIAKTEIDNLRGVNSSYILRELLVRGLVSRSPDPARQNVYRYEPSLEFLKFFGIADAAALPNRQELREKILQKNPPAPAAQPAAAEPSAS